MKMKYENIIKQMTLAEKARMMSGKNTWETVDFEKYGIPSMTMSDGPHGLRRQAGAGDHLGLNASLVSRRQQALQTAGMRHLEKKSERHLRKKQLPWESM